MTVIEQSFYESVIAAAGSIMEYLQRLTKALESIAADMSKQNTPTPLDISESAMGPGDDDPPF